MQTIINEMKSELSKKLQIAGQRGEIIFPPLLEKIEYTETYLSKNLLLSRL